MWPYMIHLQRNKILIYLAALLLIIYLWHSMFNLQDAQHLQSYHNSLQSVNFKHLLIACVLTAQKGGIEVKKARTEGLTVDVKGKTKEGADDVLTTGDKRSNMVMVNSMLYTFPGIKIVSEENLQNDDEIIELLPVKKFFNDPEYSTIPDDIEMKIDDLTVWIDPLDATKEYSEGLTHFVTTMVCVARNGEPIIGVIHQPFDSKTYWASKFGIDKKLLNSKFDASHDSSSLRVIISRSHKGNVENWLQENPRLKNLTIIEAAGSGFKTLQLMENRADIYVHKTFIKKWDICAPNVLIKFASDGSMTTLKGETIDYSFQSDVLNRDGLFATTNPKLVYLRNVIQNQL